MNAQTTIDTVDITDRTRERIRAFIYSMRPLSGVAGLAGSDEYQDGRVLLERLADSAGDGAGDPTLRFSTEQRAQVCDYLRSIEPFDYANWWVDPEDAPSRACGFQFVVGAIANSLREENPAVSNSDTRACEARLTTAARPSVNVRNRFDAFSAALANVQNKDLHALFDKLTDAMWTTWPGVKSNVTPIKPDGTLEPEDIAKRLHKHYDRLVNLTGLIKCVSKANGDEGNPDIMGPLEIAAAMLYESEEEIYQIKNDLEKMVPSDAEGS
jgi:hypothetical protein